MGGLDSCTGRDKRYKNFLYGEKIFQYEEGDTSRENGEKNKWGEKINGCGCL